MKEILTLNTLILPMTTIITIILVVLIFFLIRGVLLWYWKVNEIIKNQRETNNLINQLIEFQATGNRYGKLREGELVIKNALTGEIIKTTREKWNNSFKFPDQAKYIILEEK